MDFATSLAQAGTNLVSVPVLAFLLGLMSVAVKADLRLPDAVYLATSMYLLFAIGLKGGVALRASDPAEVLAPIAIALVLGVLIPLIAFSILGYVTKLNPVDRGAMAAHYGSTSLVTFTAAIVFLESIDIPFEGFMPTLLAILEIPGIIVGLLLAGRYLSRAEPNSQQEGWVREVIFGNSILLLAGGLLIGLSTGAEGYERVEPFFGSLFPGVLALFLLELGVLAGRRIGSVREAGVGLIVFAIVFPLFAGTLGIIGGYVAGLSVGGAMVLGVLCASASYIAAPAAVRLALPIANPGITLTASLGITFPFNLILGIPIYLFIAQSLEGWFA
jgi:hypothetical protein